MEAMNDEPSLPTDIMTASDQADRSPNPLKMNLDDNVQVRRRQQMTDSRMDLV
jgi:hypothetical protein